MVYAQFLPGTPSGHAARSDVKQEVWPKSICISGTHLVSSHLVVTSIYTLAAATQSEARVSLACTESPLSDFLLQKFPSGNP
jgi:hypothetical protein